MTFFPLYQSWNSYSLIHQWLFILYNLNFKWALLSFMSQYRDTSEGEFVFTETCASEGCWGSSPGGMKHLFVLQLRDNQVGNLKECSQRAKNLLGASRMDSSFLQGFCNCDYCVCHEFFRRLSKEAIYQRKLVLF